MAHDLVTVCSLAILGAFSRNCETLRREAALDIVPPAKLFAIDAVQAP